MYKSNATFCSMSFLYRKISDLNFIFKVKNINI
jgi:hypothetical protein